MPYTPPFSRARLEGVGLDDPSDAAFSQKSMGPGKRSESEFGGSCQEAIARTWLALEGEQQNTNLAVKWGLPTKPQ